MLAGNGLPPWHNEAWVEPKVDGWRARVVIDPDLPGGVAVRTRSGRRLELPELAPLAHLGAPIALDGELVAGAGRMSDFYSVAPALAARKRTAALTFVAFDVTFRGSDLTAASYEQRRRVLEDLDFSGPAWATLPRWPGCDGAALLDACEQLGVEGLVWKRAASPYRPGVRSSDWRKTKCRLWRTHLERRRLRP